MITVGVTGKYCAGKSTVAELLVEHGYAQIDVDRLGHEALASESERVVEAFGARVRADDGGIDRAALGGIVFADRKQLRRLEAILHPTMVEMTATKAAEIRDRGEATGVVINAAILFRMRLHPLCDTVIYVTAPFLSIWKRAHARDGASLFDVLKRLRSQHDVAPQFSHRDADIHSVENHGDREKLRSELARLLPLP